jgi:hypothetical protein
MARESQGLQVLLIIFVMLAVILGVTTYLYNKRADEATKAAVAADAREKQAKQETADKQKECDVLKTFIGFPERSAEEIKKQFTEDMETYGNAKRLDTDADKANAGKPLFDPSTLYYSRLLAGMFKVIQDRSDELIRSRALVADLETRFKNREATKDDAIAALTAGYGKLDEQVKKIEGDFNSNQQATSDQNVALATKVADIKSRADKEKAAAAEDVTNAKKVVAARDKEIGDMAGEINRAARHEMDAPSGEITWVSLPNKLVWINRGRADALQRQTKFTVYSAESTNAAKAVKKGEVEVVKIEGDHSAQARILDDKLADPIMAGDKVFTPLWSPGQQNHFALTGIMNLDGDGRNQINIVRGLIEQSGGVVDCELDEQGKKQGQITADTRYVVVGDVPDKSSQEFMKNHGAILHDVDRYHVNIIKLPDFKQQMNYQKSSSVEHFGGATTSDVSRAANAAKKTPAPKAAATKSEDEGN